MNPSGGQFDEEQMAAILKRAAQLQQRSGSPDARLSLGEIEQIAREAGIDPGYIRQAAQELSRQPRESQYHWLVGGPTTISFEYSLAGVLVGSDFDLLLEEVRTAFNDRGRVEGAETPRGWQFEWRLFNWGGVSVGNGKPRGAERSLTWRSSQANSGRDICVRVYSLNGSTVVRVEEQLAPLAGGLYGGLVGGLGGGLTVTALGLALPLTGAVLAVLAVTALTLGGSYALSRSLYRASVRSRRQQLQQLFDRLVLQVRQTLNIA